MNSIKDIVSKFKSDKKMSIVMFIGLFGALLLLISAFASTSTDEKNETAADAAADTVITQADMEEALEKKLCAMVENISGAGNAQVMIKLDSAGEYVYAENLKTEKGDSKNSSQSEIILYEENKGSKSGLIVAVKSPKVIGVAVICRGGGNVNVKAEITKLITNLFGITSEKVYVGSKI